MRVLIAMFVFTVLGLCARGCANDAATAAIEHWADGITRADCAAILHGDKRVLP